jgi:hypothetical protein
MKGLYVCVLLVSIAGFGFWLSRRASEPLATGRSKQFPLPTIRKAGTSSMAQVKPAVRLDEEGLSIIKTPPPFYPDSKEGREAVRSLSVNTSLGDWRLIGPSNFAGKVYSVAVDPLNSQNVYVAYEVGGLWGTHDGGQTWLPMFNGFQDIAFSAVKTHPNVSGMVLAGLIAYGGGYFPSFNQHVGIVLSKDSGATWTNIGPSADPGATVWDIGFGDATGQTIYAATDRGLYKTTNQGQSWSNILSYTGPQTFFFNRVSLAVDSVNSSTLLLSTIALGVMRSTDAGSTWARVDNWVNPGPSANPTLLAWSPTANIAYAYAFSNGSNTTLATYNSQLSSGSQWAAGPTTGEFNQGMYDMAIAVDPFNAFHVLLRSSINMQESTDGMQTLHDLTEPGPDCEAIVFDPNTQNVIYDGGDEGVHKSTDGGQTWTRFDTGVPNNKSIGGSNYGVGTDGRIWINPADYYGVHFTPGVGWTTAPNGYEYQSFYVNPHNPKDVYLFDSGNLYRVANSSAVYADIDPLPSLSSNPSAVEFDPVSATTLYEGKENLYKSTDSGTTWQTITIPGTTGMIQFVKVAPSNPQHLYVVANNLTWVSTNGGASWNGGASVAGTNMIAVAPSNENLVYYATSSGLFESVNGGISATQLSGFPNVSAQSVVLDPSSASNVYVALSNTGVLVSQDSGNTWSQLGALLPLVQPNWMQLQGHNLYLGTGSGVWEMNTQGLPLCGQTTITPQKIVAPSGAGTYPVELSIASTCSWTNTNNVSWATPSSTSGTGRSIFKIALAQNTTGAKRTGTVTVAGVSIPVTQLGQGEGVNDTAIVTLANGDGCLTITATGKLKAAACVGGQTDQQWTLHSAATRDFSSPFWNLQLSDGLNYFVSNGSNCLDVTNGAIQIGSKLAGVQCGYGENETFNFEPQTNGKWLIAGLDSGLCIDAIKTTTSLKTCAATNTAQAFTIAPASFGGGASVKFVFATVGGYTGNLGGTAGANNICQAEANNASLAGTYKAWLSSGAAGDNPAASFTHSTVPYVNTDASHTQVASGWADLTTSGLANPITLLGGASQVGGFVWTGTNNDGTSTIDSAGDYSCTKWTDASNPNLGLIGDQSPLATWTVTGTVTNCSNAIRLYCFKQ